MTLEVLLNTELHKGLFTFGIYSIKAERRDSETEELLDVVNCVSLGLIAIEINLYF